MEETIPKKRGRGRPKLTDEARKNNNENRLQKKRKVDMSEIEIKNQNDRHLKVNMSEIEN